MHEYGLDPGVALASATTTARAYLGLPDLEVGSPADVVLYDANPLDDPEVLAHPALVMGRGRHRGGGQRFRSVAAIRFPPHVSVVDRWGRDVRCERRRRHGRSARLLTGRRASAPSTLFVEDLAATRDFYREVFGLPVVLRTTTRPSSGSGTRSSTS